jgi:hypothetical protein
MNGILLLIAVASVMPKYFFPLTSETLIIQFGVIVDWGNVPIP